MKKPIEKKEKMVAKLIAANKELVLQNKEMSQQTTELMVVNKELKQIKETLLLSESRYRRLFETAKDGIIILDAETGLILDVNPFLIEKLGYSKEQFIDKEIWEIGFFNDIIENQDRFLELQQKEYVRYEDLPLKTIDGRQLNVEFISNVYLENTHKVIQCNIRDITERKVTEVELNNYRNHLEFLVKERTEKLEIAIQTKNKFFSIIAHDLRNPFHALIGLSRISLTQIKNREYENLEMQVSMIHEATKNGYALLENLLEWASLQLGQIEVKKEVFNVSFVIKDTLASIHNIAREKKIKLVVLTQDVKNENVFFDLEMFKTILRNLVTNAIKYSKEGETLLIEIVDADEKCLKLTENDTGIGISKENIENLFRIDVPKISHGTNNEKGTGLGLLLCVDFAKQNNSEILVESIEYKGSTFSFNVDKAATKADIIKTSPIKAR